MYKRQVLRGAWDYNMSVLRDTWEFTTIVLPADTDDKNDQEDQLTVRHKYIDILLEKSSKSFLYKVVAICLLFIT